jgi:hypothetical protein
MKKRIISLLLIVITMFSFSSTAFATSEDAAGNEYSINEMNDDRLLEMIVENSELAINGIAVEEAPISSDVSLVSHTDYVDGSSKSIYDAEINIGIVFDETINKDGTVSAVARAINTKTESSDTSFSSDVEITCTITYESGSMLEGGAYVDYLKLTNVSASFVRKDTTCTLSNKKVRGRYSGYNLSTSQFVNYTSPWYATTSASISGAPLESTSGGMSCWLYGDGGCTVTRGNQTWDLVFTVVHTEFSV